MSRWYVVHAHTRGEEMAARHLRNQGFDAYLPRYRRQRRHARRVETVSAPLFPRYLFVKLDLAAQRWRPIKGTIGVSHMVCHGDRPAPVPEGVVEAIKEREDEAGLVMLERRRFRKGERLRIAEGAFADTVGLFEDMANDERVIMLLDLLGRTIRVRVPIRALAGTD